MATTSFEAALSRRQELLEIICEAANEIKAIDGRLPILKSMALESDLLQAEPVLYTV
jgi:hypothetical protein